MSNLVGPAAVVASESFDLQYEVRDFAVCMLMKSRSGGHSLMRSTAAAYPGISVTIQLDGVSAINQGAVHSTIHEGDMLLWRGGEEYTRVFDSPGTTLFLHVPASQLSVPIEIARNQPVEVLRADEGLPAVLAALIQAAWASPGLTEPASVRLGRAISETLSSLLWELAGDSSYVRFRQTMGDAMSYVREHLNDSSLDVSTIARAGHCSVRHLQKAFSSVGTTVSAWIREERLQAASAILADPVSSGRGIAEISEACGWSNHSHFSRVFGERFGVTPAQWRAKSARPNVRTSEQIVGGDR